MITFRVIEGQQKSLIKLNQDDGVTATVVMIKYNDNSQEHVEFNLDMTQVNELINEMTHGINKLKEVQKQIIKNSYNKFVATANESD